jgi:hypothetical protein
MNEKRSDWVRLLIKYKAKCRECGKEILSGEYALWSRGSRSIKHIKCAIHEDGPSSSYTKDSNTSSNRSSTSFSMQQRDTPCYICNKLINCLECGFEEKSNRYDIQAKTSVICICNECLMNSEAYETYQKQFIAKMSKISEKVKLI